MKIKLEKDIYATDEGSGPKGKCKLDYLWIGSDYEVIGTLTIKQLERFLKAMKLAEKRRKE